MSHTEIYYTPLDYVVEEADEGRPLGEVLRRRMGLSRRLIVKLKQSEQGISVNGEKAWARDLVSAGDRIALRIEAEQSLDIFPQPMDLDIAFEDEHLLVVNKPAGVIVHPTTGHYMNTLANGVVHHWQEKGERVRFRPVNRLDQDTSGLVIIAKHAYANQQLAEQMKAGTVDKMYRAYVYGRPPEQEGEVNEPIDRSSEDPHRRVVRGDGYPSLTYYKVKQAFACGASSLDIRLGTGRTHQIRVHMLHVGCPLIGDSYYADTKWISSALHAKLSGTIARQALHAIRLSFNHPVTGTPLTLEAALPDDIRRLESELNAIDTL
jgi:23S rRNA pseudouridine1911/1915/1917 synthase